MERNENKQLVKLIQSYLIFICLIILGLGYLSGITFQIEAIRFRYPLDYGEAPLINQAVFLNTGEAIYQTNFLEPPFTITNYPPIYIGFLSIFEQIFGPAFWYGRLISSLSAHGSALMIILLVYSYSHNIKHSLIPGLLFLNIPTIIHWSTLARIDHLALFFALTGLFLLTKYHQNYSRSNFYFGSFFLILGIFTRQSFALAAPMAGFLLLLNRDWRKALLLAVVVGGGSLLIFLTIDLLTDGGFFFNIVRANVNPFGFDRLIHHFKDYFNQAWLLFCLSALGSILIIKRISGWPLFAGFLLGGFVSALTIGKIGSNINYFLEFSAAMCLMTGLAMTIILKTPRQGWANMISVLVLLALAWQGVQFVREVQVRRHSNLAIRAADLDSLKTLEHLVGQHISELILADEYMGMILLNGGSLYFQPFEMTQLANAGIWDQQILIDQIMKETFPLILIQRASWWEGAAQERWTPEMLSAVETYYQKYAQLENTFIYRPKSEKTTKELIKSCPEGRWPLPTEAYIGYRYRDGFLTLYGAGGEGQVPVIAVADGWLFRPKDWNSGLMVAYADPYHPGEKVIMVYEDLISFDGNTSLISDAFPPGSEGVLVQQGDVLGYQSFWTGKAYRQTWLHVRIGLAPFDEVYLKNSALILDELINPEAYFGIEGRDEALHLLPLKCQ